MSVLAFVGADPRSVVRRDLEAADRRRRVLASSCPPSALARFSARGVYSGVTRDLMRSWLPLIGTMALALAACAGDAPLEQPSAVEAPSPFEYPVALWDSAVQGETDVLVHVTTAGAVDSVRVARPSGHAEFDSAAVVGAYKLRFLPAHRGGQTLPAWVRLPVRFSRDSSAADTAH
jgi:TonB family protein